MLGSYGHTCFILNVLLLSLNFHLSFTDFFLEIAKEIKLFIANFLIL